MRENLAIAFWWHLSLLWKYSLNNGLLRNSLLRCLCILPNLKILSTYNLPNYEPKKWCIKSRHIKLVVGLIRICLSYPPLPLDFECLLVFYFHTKTETKEWEQKMRCLYFTSENGLWENAPLVTLFVATANLALIEKLSDPKTISLGAAARSALNRYGSAFLVHKFLRAVSGTDWFWFRFKILLRRNDHAVTLIALVMMET